jgi:hypothetical protein
LLIRSVPLVGTTVAVFVHVGTFVLALQKRNSPFSSEHGSVFFTATTSTEMAKGFFGWRANKTLKE